jgi:hypothetical protein
MVVDCVERKLIHACKYLLQSVGWQESQLLGSNLGQCSKPALTQRGQYSPLSAVFTAQLLCSIIDISAQRPVQINQPYDGKSWMGFNITQALELVLGDSDRSQV